MALNTTTAIQEIEAADARRVAATLAKDASALRQVLSDDMLYVHGSAVAESRDVFIERATTGFYEYKTLTNIRRNFRIYGDAALVDGDVRIQVDVKGAAKDFVSRYLQAWVKKYGRWQMTSWQSTPVPSA